MNWNKTLAVFMIILFVFVLLVPVTPAPTSPLEGPVIADGETAELTTVVTLITGDVLEITEVEEGRYAVLTESDRSFQILSTDEDTYVVPADLGQFIGETLDMQLFNIDYLVEHGYCDAETEEISIIIEYTDNPGIGNAPIDQAPGLTKKFDFEAVIASSADVTKEDADEFADAVFYTEGGLDGVTKIWLDQEVELSLDESVPGIGAPYAWEQGYNGTSIKVAVLDTGIWKDHPDLAGKVIAEKDFTDDETTEDLYGHGTHCAGIAAASGLLKGVAPGASLINAKVLNKAGKGYTSWIMAAWEWAAEQGANIFSMSFGTAPTDGKAPWDKALDTLVDECNIVAVAAAGNDKKYYKIASPAAADKAIAVGASTKRGLPKLSVVSPEAKDIKANLFEYSPKPTVEGLEKPIVYAGLGSTWEFAKVDVAGKIALIRRGRYSFKVKVENAANAGAVGAIIFNSIKGNFYGTLVEPAEIPAVSISREDGTYLRGLLAKGEVIVNLRWDSMAIAIADLSSRGPRLDQAVKPEIVAPGINILSTVPTYECEIWHPSGYEYVSGTSMSTPHIAGAAALLLQKHPDWTPMQVRDAMMSVAELISDEDIYTQGAGHIDVSTAVDAQVIFEPAVINFGSISKPWPVQTKSFTIRNYGDSDVTLELSVEKVHDITKRYYDIISIDKTSVTVPAHGFETATIAIDVSSDLVPVDTPLGGRIHAKNVATGEKIHAIFGIYKKWRVDLKIKVISPDGQPWAYAAYNWVFDAIIPWSKGGFLASYVRLDENGEAVLKVPPGIYNVITMMPPWTYTWPNREAYFIQAIEIPAYEDVSVTLDARESKPITLNIYEPTVPVQSESWLRWTYPNSTEGLGWGWTGRERWIIHATPVTAEIGEINMGNRFIEIPGTSLEDVKLQKATRLYDLYYPMIGKVETPIEYVVDETTLQELAMVSAKHFTDMKVREAQYYRLAIDTVLPRWPFCIVYKQRYIQPIERAEYVSPLVASYKQVIEPSVAGEANIKFDEPFRVYEIGERTEKTWLEQPMKPWFTEAWRSGNRIYVAGLGTVDAKINMPLTDRTLRIFKGLAGYVYRMRVYRDGTLILDWEKPYELLWDQTVVPEEANYRIELYTNFTHTRRGPIILVGEASDFSESSDSEYYKPIGPWYSYRPYWNNMSIETFTTIRFKSSEAEGTETLPIMNLNYKIPGLRINNAKKVSENDPLNIHIIPQHLKGFDIGEVRFWFSYDDGETWTETPALEGTDEWMVWPDSEPENYISIKTLATDVEGNSIEQTIMRAFYVTTKPQKFWFDD